MRLVLNVQGSTIDQFESSLESLNLVPGMNNG